MVKKTLTSIITATFLSMFPLTSNANEISFLSSSEQSFNEFSKKRKNKMFEAYLEQFEEYFLSEEGSYDMTYKETFWQLPIMVVYGILNPSEKTIMALTGKELGLKNSYEVDYRKGIDSVRRVAWEQISTQIGRKDLIEKYGERVNSKYCNLNPILRGAVGILGDQFVDYAKASLKNRESQKEQYEGEIEKLINHPLFRTKPNIVSNLYVSKLAGVIDRGEKAHPGFTQDAISFYNDVKKAKIDRCN